MESLNIGIISGILSSWIFWAILNLLVTPRITADNQIQYSGKKRYVRIYNKSWFTVYNVTFYIKYTYDDGNCFFRTDVPLPYLEKGKGVYNLELNKNSGRLLKDNVKNSEGDPLQKRTVNSMPVEKFFLQNTGTIVLAITYQSRFGIRRTIAPITYTYSKEPGFLEEV